MNNNLLQLIKGLSLRDTKTLSQKSLKLFEEGGELAGKVLALENADGSRHKVFYNRDILEECADAILVALSVAYSLGYEDDAIESMMAEKTMKWSGLKELDTSDGKYPFEIHLTIDNVRSEDLFIYNCKQHGCKPIILDLPVSEGSEKQITTSSVVFGSPQDAYTQAKKLATLFEHQLYYDVTRIKIETVPWHPMTSEFNNKNYFESHFTFIADDKEAARITSHCKSFGVHMSRNALRYEIDGMKKFMGTVRSSSYRQSHDITVERILKKLKDNDIVPIKSITEYAFYDTNRQMDRSWLGDSA